MVPPQVSGILHFFSRYFYDARSGLRARSVPDGFGVLPVFLVPAFLASVKSLPHARRYLLVTLAGGVLVDKCGARAPRSRSRRM
jgi:hypothetical protein